jgi:integrase
VQRNDGGGVEIRPPKYGSERTVYLPDDLVQLLARHVECHRPGDDPGRWLFEGLPGDPPHQNTVGYWWPRRREAPGSPAPRCMTCVTTLRQV